MKTKNIAYKLVIILLCLFYGPNGISSLAAQEADSTRINPIAPLDSLRTDSVKGETIVADSMAADSIEQANLKNLEKLEAVTDTSLLVKKNDSIAVQKPMVKFVPNPTRALWLSLIIPGAGQVYNRKYWKIPIVYGGFLGCVYALTWNGQMYKDYSQAYLDIMDNDPNTDSYLDMLPINYDITGKEERFKEIFKNKKNFYRKYRDLSIFCMVGVYLLSVVDAYVDAELSSFDISKDLGLKIEPTIMNNGHLLKNQTSVGLQCRLNF